jgi:hypothetical protein
MRNFFRVSVFTAILTIAMTGCKPKPTDDGDDNDEVVVSGQLTVSNLPLGKAYSVEIYKSGTTLTLGNQGQLQFDTLGVAKGSNLNSNSNVFILNKWDGRLFASPQTKWEETGVFPLYLMEVNEGSTFIVGIKHGVTFTKGVATIDFSQME